MKVLFTIERKKQQEETIQREQVVEQVERYEESMQERPNPKTTQIRTSETLMPTVLPNTARDIYGRPVKGKTIAIGKVTPDAGNVTIWGEIFDLEGTFYQRQKKKIYSIKITDYTGSMTLKIIDDVANCRSLDMLKKGSAILTRGEIEYVNTTVKLFAGHGVLLLLNCSKW